MREQQDAASPAAAAAAADELERRSRFLSSLLGRTKLSPHAEGDEEGTAKSAEAGEEEEGSKKKEKVVVRVMAADMPAALQRRAFGCAREALAAMPHYPRRLEPKRLALALKKEFDSAYGPAWHCIVGTSFGSYVTHSLGGFVYFSVDKVYILLFRTAVEPLAY